MFNDRSIPKILLIIFAVIAVIYFEKIDARIDALELRLEGYDD